MVNDTALTMVFEIFFLGEDLGLQGTCSCTHCYFLFWEIITPQKDVFILMDRSLLSRGIKGIPHVLAQIEIFFYYFQYRFQYLSFDLFKIFPLWEIDCPDFLVPVYRAEATGIRTKIKAPSFEIVLTIKNWGC